MNSDYNEELEPMGNIAHALFYIGYQLKQLGNADATTPMGALEALGKVLKENSEAQVGIIDCVADAIGGLAASVDEHGQMVIEIAKSLDTIGKISLNRM